MSEIVKKDPQSLVANDLKPIFSLSQIIEAKKELDQLVTKGLKENVDYGLIPNTKKPTLFLPGAQQLATWFHVTGNYVIMSEEHNHDRINHFKDSRWENNKKVFFDSTSEGLHAYRIECNLVNRATGQVIGSGVGACSTMESKYISRPHDLDNTVLKMAKKRAFVDAVLMTFGLTGRFTQDMEDLYLEENGKTPRGNSSSPKPAQSQPKPQTVEKPVTDEDFGVFRTSLYQGKKYIWTKENEMWSKEVLLKRGYKENNGSFFKEHTEQDQYLLRATMLEFEVAQQPKKTVNEVPF